MDNPDVWLWQKLIAFLIYWAQPIKIRIYAQGHYVTMVSQICNRLNINFFVFSLSLGDLVAYKFFNFYQTIVVGEPIYSFN
jgi:hypothetical protein